MRILVDLQGAQTESRFRGIGRYSLSLALAMARNAGEHDIWLVLNAALPESVLTIRRAFDGLIPQERIRVFEVPTPVAELNPTNAWRTRTAEKVREHFLQQLKPGVVHVSSLFEGYVDDAVTSVGAFTLGMNTAVTLYDLIPLVNQKTYLPSDLQRDYYLRKVQSLENAELLLAISESSRREAINALQLAEDRIVNISSAIDDSFHPLQLSEERTQQLRCRYGIQRKMVMYAPGGFDQRKNLDGLIEAYALLPSELRSSHQLVIVSKISDGDRANLQRLRKQAGLTEDELVLTGYVSDDDLVSLYNIATLFVFPSKHEGFGLPALEAMACGAPTIGSNSSSVPEVIGWGDALFDPTSRYSVAEKMSRALQDENWRTQLRVHGLQQAMKFSWDSCAKAVISAFDNKIKRSGYDDNSWKQTFREYEQSQKDLIAEISEVVACATDNDLKSLAEIMARNLEQIDHVLRRTDLPEHLTWRIEGPFDSSYSLALLNRETALALEELGHQVILHSTEGPGDFAPNTNFLLMHPELARLNHRAAEFNQKEADLISRNLYPPRVSDMRGRINLLHHYAWEESGFPMNWVDAFDQHLQGITCLSRHVEKILIDNGVSVPLTTSGCGVDHWERIKPDEKFFVVGKSFKFLHVSSCFPRKGVDCLLDAYGKAFRADDDVTLAIKTFANPHNTVYDLLSVRRSADPGFPHVVVIEGDLNDGELKALYMACDVLVVPSRAEGFGLPMAEAMLSSLPVITTGWSGQLDFCDEKTSWLIDYRFSYATSHFGVFDSVWAEPDVDHLAVILQEVRALPDSVRAGRAEAGRARLLDGFRWRHVAKRLVNAARTFATMPPKPKLRLGWISTWNTRCGIATYSEHLTGAMEIMVDTVLAAYTSENTVTDGSNVIRCWRAGGGDDLLELEAAIDTNDLNTLVIQFNYGFFQFDAFSRFLRIQLNRDRIVLVMLHSTSDPAHDPSKRLSKIAGDLSQCHRILVPSVNDLNRLKKLGLVDNVVLFPAGLIDNVPAEVALSIPEQRFVVASYGFFLPHKGLLELLDAVAILVRSGVNIQLLMVNAEYPIRASVELILEARKRIAHNGLKDRVMLITDFLSDELSLGYLDLADLIVYPYQGTGESASAAVRMGIAAGKLVAVTPLPIFDDVRQAVFTLPGTSPDALAEGIGNCFSALREGRDEIQIILETMRRWRDAHTYPLLARRLSGMLIALKRKETEMVGCGNIV